MSPTGSSSATAAAAAHDRELISVLFQERIASGDARPLLIVHSLIANFAIPCLYLAVPHRGRPWLYRARFLVAALVALLNLEMGRHTRSDNLAVTYATGILAAWGTLWALTSLVIRRPQYDAERVNKRRKQQNGSARGRSGSSSRASPERAYSSALSSSGIENGNGSKTNGVSNGTSNGNGSERLITKRRRKSVRFLVAPDEDVAKSIFNNDMEYYWQAFPEDAPFRERLSWAYDYYTAWRGSGWNFAIPTIPSFDPPRQSRSGELVQIETIPIRSRAGVTRPASNRELLLTRLGRPVLAYLALDVCATLMKYDPYFRTGRHEVAPSPSAPLAPHLPPALLYIYRSVLASMIVFNALWALFSLDQVIRRWLMTTLFGKDVRTELWQYSDTFGSFVQILDHGLGGLWGRSWHQTFRIGFTAPSVLLLAGTKNKAAKKLLSSLVAFCISGAMHAAGSFTMPRGARPWMPWLFFILAWVGTVVQTTLYYGLRLDRVAPRLPSLAPRTSNLLFSCAWMLLTCWVFVDDMCRAGMWMLEPVPFSFARAAGLGLPGDQDPWRIKEPLIYWHSGRHWWDTGLAA
ncbi:hypothetical protein MCOR25_010393 [Pyricularia grisea]|uniref:Wax synthase domain-containing protein n=1 Tax=Pyricularia grisea TaxID=148305 RepID=A0A6P8BDP3_PYRGI|nr:uncharacterized protein PgNI_03878 [Pyricularia grisea]KAI6350785.1 hypothetical protein MCOR25_010393 [Pyricularia grisea]TLD13991.1 hypothetical protein PgNI_03878 [Pyricularia grisea]